MSGILKVFISSTSFDLAEHRAEVSTVIRKLKLLSDMMEDWNPGTRSGLQTSLEKVDDADVYIGIFGFRYGATVEIEGKKQSITEAEYDRAVQRGIVRFCFLMSDDHLITVKQVQFKNWKLLKRFKARLKKEETTKDFSSPSNLALNVSDTLRDHLAVIQGRPAQFNDIATRGDQKRVTASSPTSESQSQVATQLPGDAGHLGVIDKAGAAIPERSAPRRKASDRIEILFQLAVSTDRLNWRLLGDGGSAPRNAYVRIMVRPKVSCHVVAMIETLDGGERTTNIHLVGVLGPVGTPQDEALGEDTISSWHTIPEGKILTEQNPGEVAAWKIGLLVSSRRPDRLIQALEQDAQPGSVQNDNRLKLIRSLLPVADGRGGVNALEDKPEIEIVSGFGLVDSRLEPLGLAGKGDFLHWMWVRFE